MIEVISKWRLRLCLSPGAVPLSAALVLGGGGRGKLCLMICRGDNKRLLFAN